MILCVIYMIKIFPTWYFPDLPTSFLLSQNCEINNIFFGQKDENKTYFKAMAIMVKDKSFLVS